MATRSAISETKKTKTAKEAVQVIPVTVSQEETVKPEAEKAEPAEKPVKAAAKPVEAVAEKKEEKKAPEKKTSTRATAKKETTTKRTAAAKKETAPKKETAAKKAAAKKETTKKETTAKRTTSKKEIKINAIVEHYGKQIGEQDIIANVKKAWTNAGRVEKDIKSIELYIKPEENAVYYVINETETGAVALYE